MLTKVGHLILPAEVGYSEEILAAQRRIDRARCEDSNAFCLAGANSCGLLVGHLLAVSMS